VFKLNQTISVYMVSFTTNIMVAGLAVRSQCVTIYHCRPSRSSSATEDRLQRKQWWPALSVNLLLKAVLVKEDNRWQLHNARQATSANDKCSDLDHNSLSERSVKVVKFRVVTILVGKGIHSWLSDTLVSVISD
jgi:hypothetical protein